LKPLFLETNCQLPRLLISKQLTSHANTKQELMLAKKEKFTVLLIEDNEGDILLTRKAIGMCNVETDIHVAKNGREGLEFLYKMKENVDKPTPDLVLLDLNMPEVNGIEVLKEVKKNSILKKIPVIVLTTSTSDTDIIESYNLNANSYISKPIDFFRFGEAISKLLNYWFNVVLLPIRH